MKVNREDLPERQAALVIVFDKEEIEPALDKTYRKLVNRVNVPGFRPGKAPRRLFESYVGREALVQEATQDLMPGAIDEAVKMNGLESAEVNDVDIESTDPLTVRVLLDLDPLVELGDYSDLRVAREPVTVTDEQVDGTLRDLRSREGSWHDLAEPRPAQLYDRVTVDMETFTTDGPVANMTGEDITFQISDRTGPGWPKEIDQNLIGMNIGDEKDFAITFPEKYNDEELRGKDATVHVVLKGLQEEELPELTDEFAQKLTDVQTVDELMERLRNNLQTSGDNDARQKQIDTAISGLVERSTIEVPKAMIDHEVEHRYEHLQNDLKERRITAARYFTYFGNTEAEWRAQQREQAVPSLREILALRAFAEREGILVTEDDVNADLESRLAEMGDAGQNDAVRELLNTEDQKRQIENRIFERKLTDRLLEIVEGTREAAPAQAADEHDHSGHDHDHDHAEHTHDEAAEAQAGAEDADTEAAVAATPEISGSVPAEDQEPSALEEAGGAAEVLGAGDQTEQTNG